MARFDSTVFSSGRVALPYTATFDKCAALHTHYMRVLRRPLDPMEVFFEDSFVNNEDKTAPVVIPENVYDLDVRNCYNKSTRILEWRCKECRAFEPVAGNVFPEPMPKHLCGSCARSGRKVRQMRIRGKLLYGSAVDYEAAMNGIGTIPGVGHLAGLMNYNNQTGDLKKFPQSFVALIRILYEVGHSVSFLEHRRNVIAMFAPVMEAYYAACEKDFAAVEAIDKRVFTLEGYANLLQILGRSEADIKRACDDFLPSFDLAERRKQQAEARAASVRVERYPILAKNAGGLTSELHVIESDDRMIASPYFKLHRKEDVPGMLLICGSNGGYGLFSNGPWNLQPLFMVLNNLEAGRPHFEERYVNQMVLYGSGSRLGHRSRIRRPKLIQLIQRYTRTPHYIGRPKRGSRARRDVNTRSVAQSIATAAVA